VKLTDDIMHLALHAGCSSNKHLHLAKGNITYIDGRQVISNYDVWRMSLILGKKKPAHSLKQAHASTPTEGPVLELANSRSARKVPSAYTGGTFVAQTHVKGTSCVKALSAMHSSPTQTHASSPKVPSANTGGTLSPSCVGGPSVVAQELCMALLTLTSLAKPNLEGWALTHKVPSNSRRPSVVAQELVFACNSTAQERGTLQVLRAQPYARFLPAQTHEAPYGHYVPDLWSVSQLTHTHDLWSVGQEEKVLPFEGSVYCLSVPNEIFYVRRNGLPVWTGNSRSTGPYSLVTQQPLRGRSKQGGQRLGEMEVWALEGYGAAFTLLEMLTIKSDDMTGRMTLWSNLILNKEINIGTPESFKVLVCELQALCLDIGLFRFSNQFTTSKGLKPTINQGEYSNSVQQYKNIEYGKPLIEIENLMNLP
jgi:hypothetical protein